MLRLGRHRIAPAELLAGLAGVGLLLSLFLPWNGTRTIAALPPLPDGTPRPQPDTVREQIAWESFAVLDLVLVLVALLGIALLVVTATQPSVAVPVAFGVLTAAVGILGTLLVLVRGVLLRPGDADELLAGTWLGLVATALVALGGWWSMADERPRWDPESPPGHDPTARPAAT